MSKFPQFILLLFALNLLTFVSLPVQAKKVEHLYQIDIPTNQQSNKARWKASLDGFKVILVRRSGSVEILNSPEAKSGYKKVTSFVQKFEYANNPSDISQYIITLYFEPRLIDDLIKRANMPVWDFNRPMTILWIAQEFTEDGFSLNRQVLVDNEKFVSEVESLKENAKRRGVPIIFPLMDLDDELLVSQSDVWGRFSGSILQASQRYSADALIIGKAYHRDEDWIGQFNYINNSNKESFEFESNNVENLYGLLVDKLAETLCQQYCIDGTESEGKEILLQIENITNFQTFVNIEKYLSELSVVHSIQTKKLFKDKVIFKLGLLSDQNSVLESLSLNHQLKKVEVNLKTEIKQSEVTNDLDERIDLESNITIDKNDLDVNNQSQETTTELQSKVETFYFRWIN